ncbi:hypothetical protein KGY79_00845 [Candidatus Bipolaricaulota bacterium]|nr:hypothetical protein [Candidatus Bipolaricaulota bacterium]
MNSKDIISQAAEKDELTHAYLAPVRSGTNLKSYAAELGQIILCSPDDKDCRGKVIRDTHPDFIQVKVLNNNSKISINQVEEIISRSSYSPVESQRKLYAINRAEDLSIEGANSLLKILEGPPEFVYFLLLTESPNSLLPTIISRCQQLPRGGTSIEGMKDLLSSKGFNDQEVNYLIEVVNRRGNLLDDLLEEDLEKPLEKREGAFEEYDDSELVELSKCLVDSDSYLERDALTRVIYGKLPEASHFQLIGSAGELAKSSQNYLEWFLERGLNIYRNGYREGVAEEFYSRAGNRESLRKVRILDRALGSLTANVNHQLLLESVLLKLSGSSASFDGKDGV